MSNLQRKTFLFFAFGLCVIASLCSGEYLPCDLRETKYGSVCVCTESYCDFLDDRTPEDLRQLHVVSSSKAGLRFGQRGTGKFNVFMKYFVVDYDQRNSSRNKSNFDSIIDSIADTEDVPTRKVKINVNRSKKFQKIVGFGGSYTGAVSYLMDLIPKELQDKIYESFYADKGLGFNLMRVPIGGCDFDLSPWAYNEIPENDLELTNFTIDPRDELRFSQIRRLIEVSKVENLKIKGAAWSSPRWMKSNNKWTGRSHLKKEFYQTWADYHLKWLEMMEENGLPVWAISTGNEPMNGVLFMFFVRFMSLGWTPKNQAIWLNDHLGPTIRNSAYKDIILFGNDDQRYTFPTWFHMMEKSREGSTKYLDGLAVHWYWDEIFGPSFIDKARAEMPEKILLTTESCIGDKPWQKAAPLLGSWERGEKYARAFMQDFQHGFNGWIDWNIILDEKGGPNYVDNTVDAPVIVDTANMNEVLKQPMFYVMGHFSKFAPENSHVIESIRSNVNIDTVAFERPNGKISVVILNTGRANIEVSIVDSKRGNATISLPPKSIHTVLYN